MKPILKCLFVLTCLVTWACSGSPSGSGEESTATTTQAITSVNGKTPWLVVLCTFSDNTAKVPANGNQAFYQKLFATSHTGAQGTGGIFDYWRDQSSGKIDLTGTVVTGELNKQCAAGQTVGCCPAGMPVPCWTNSGAKQNSLNADALACINTQQGRSDFKTFYNYLALYNYQTSIGVQAEGLTIGGRPVIAVIADNQNTAPSSVEQEMGHGYSLGHTFDDTMRGCGGAPGEYCDPYDVMSGIQNQFSGNYCMPPFFGCLTGPGLNMWYRNKLGWEPEGSLQGTTPWPAYAAQGFTIAPRGHKELFTGSVPMQLLVRAHPGSMYSVEFVSKDGWDQGIPKSSLLIRRIYDKDPNGRPDTSYLLAEPGGVQTAPGAAFDEGVARIELGSIQGTPPTATVGVYYSPAYPTAKTQWWPNKFNGACGGNFVADVTGDGVGDLVGLGCGSVSVVPSNLDFGDFEGLAQWWPNTFNGQYGNFVVDVTGDGKADLIGVGSGFVGVVPATPEGASTGTGFGAYETWHGSANGAVANFVADVTGDTKGDLVKLDSSSITVYPATPQGAGVRAKSFGTGTKTSGTFFGSFGTFLGDVDGDGRADVVALKNGMVSVALSTGTGFGTPQQWLNRTFCGAGSLGSFLADVTGDGKADIICTGQGSIDIAVSTGQSFATETWSTLTFTGNIATRVADVDGNGLADLISFDNGSVSVLPTLHW